MGVYFDINELPAPEVSLALAQQEVTRLRKQMLLVNEKYANLVVKAEQDRRSLAGQIRALMKELAEARELISQLRAENHGLPQSQAPQQEAKEGV